jgi:hypothetical protein
MYDNSSPGAKTVDGAVGEATRKAAWIRQTAAVGAVRALVDVLGVGEVLPVKGVVTARTLYPDPSDRPIADVDVRVRGPEALSKVLAYATAHDRLKKSLPVYDNVVLTIEGVEVDVESHVGPIGICAMTTGAMLARAKVRGDVFGFPCAIPELHDHAMLMVVNAFKDKLVLAHEHSVTDLVLVAHDPALDPDRLARLARDVGCAALTWIVADWLATEKGSEPWRRVRDAIGPRPPRRAYVRLFQRLAPRAPLSLASRVLARLASDDPAMRLQALLRAVRFEARR